MSSAGMRSTSVPSGRVLGSSRTSRPPFARARKQAHATFTTDPGATVGVYFNHDFGTGNYITTAIVNGNGGSSLFVDFAKPVRDLKFVVLAANAAGPCASVNVFQRGAKTATVPIVGVGDPLVNVPVDLSTDDDVTRIEIVNVTDFDNIAYDDFTFSFPM
jgi:hypothetical protein